MPFVSEKTVTMVGLGRGRPRSQTLSVAVQVVHCTIPQVTIRLDFVNALSL